MHIPTATYRVQLNAGFGFRELAGIVDYLADLGISDIYASPIFKASPGSMHGYDVVDPNQLNPELGTGSDWQALTRQRRALGMGWLQDIVPNHMAYSGLNPHIRMLLETGPRPGHTDHFDVLWHHPRPEFNGRVSAPFLGRGLRQCLELDEIALEYDKSGLSIAYYEHRFPLALQTYPFVFSDHDAGIPADRTSSIHGWIEEIKKLGQSHATKSNLLESIKENLWRRYRESPAIREFVTQRLHYFNQPDDPSRLLRLLEKQYFHLGFWKSAARAVNYRRFFSINGLIAVRQEDRRIFEQTHSLIQHLTQNGVFTGLRVDHIDGLLAPAVYLDRLRETCGDCYLIVEKILGADETLPEDWPVQGTSGYEFAARLDRLFTFSGNASQMETIYMDFCGPQPDFETEVRRCKNKVLQTYFSGDLDNVVAKFKSLSDLGEFSSSALHDAISRLLIHMPVYRTYLSDITRRSTDAEIITAAVHTAEKQGNDSKTCLQKLVRLMIPAPGAAGAKQPAWSHNDARIQAVGAFEQLCTALTAKGVEDTALYRYHRLIALNEVGGQPQRFGASRGSFHHFANQRQQHHPHALNVLSTHDSKRCSDVRARLLVLSEMPEQWAHRVAAWKQMNRGFIRTADGRRRPDAAMEYLLYQTLVGTFPIRTGLNDAYKERIKAYMLKAAREAKIHTDWAAPNLQYEDRLQAFCDDILAMNHSQPFLDDMRDFVERLAGFALMNVLAQTLIQLTAPGVPDIYQGTELLCDSLVDPDNRRPVDYEKRRGILSTFRRDYQTDPAGSVADALRADNSDRIKLLLIHAVLQARRRFTDLFTQGDYLALELGGPRAFHAMAYARIGRNRWCVTAVPRFLSLVTGPSEAIGRTDIWQETFIQVPARAPRQWRCLLTGVNIEAHDGKLDIEELFAAFPVALITAETSSGE